jgi:cation diffusion facilitator CzcD-associated flavoprotein CzcO
LDQFNSVGRRVCVIGAGIAGLVTAKVLRDDGFHVVVFEKLPTIGGVWAPRHTYPGLRTNSPRETYAFSDFPYLARRKIFPLPNRCAIISRPMSSISAWRRCCSGRRCAAYRVRPRIPIARHRRSN